jgi:hypothetical protein
MAALVRWGMIRRMRIAIADFIGGTGVPDLAPAVGVGRQRPIEPGGEGCAPVVMAAREQLPYLLVRLGAGERPEPLDRPENGQQLVDRFGQVADGALPSNGQRQLGG